jgi:hypothetical protein
MEWRLGFQRKAEPHRLNTFFSVLSFIFDAMVRAHEYFKM